MICSSSFSRGAPASPSSQQPPLHFMRSQTNCASTTASLTSTLSIAIICVVENLLICNSQLAVGSSQLAVGSLQFAVGNWQLQLAVGSFRLAVGRSQLAIGNYQSIFLI